ncbi:MAG: hypothetical protein K2X50_01275 [Gammaproteobacteria bacterium]|nr:hypothetical protein [Gammaproteobacteria bacterium]
MKRLLSIVCVFALLCSSVMAANHKTGRDCCKKNRDYWNPITVHNYAPYSVTYSFNSGVDYNLDRSETDIYHSGAGDARAYLVIRGCTERNADGYCLTATSHMFPEYYNAEKIATINIKSVFDAEIICIDGTTTSCIIK